MTLPFRRNPELTRLGLVYNCTHKNKKNESFDFLNPAYDDEFEPEASTAIVRLLDVIVPRYRFVLVPQGHESIN
jgi:hypothetical protein